MENMESRLYEAALTGNVETLQKLFQENPLILTDYSFVSPNETPLHIATKSGKLSFVKELIRLKPELVMEQNNEGFRPLDIASGLGHVEIVKELLLVWNATTSSGSEICRLKGRDGRTSIHYVVVHDKIDVMNEVISFSAKCVKDLTDFEETTLHLAVKYYIFEVFKKLVEWLEKLGLEEIVNWVDRDGNTILHLAVSRKQHRIVEFLLNNNNIFSTLKLNERNSKGLTSMDLVMENPSDVQLIETLRLAGAVRGRDINTTNTISSSSPPLQHIPSPEQDAVETDWIKYFRYKHRRDSPSDTRNALLVVAALIATVTFQAGVDPSDGFLPKKSETSISSNTSAEAPPPTVNKHPGVVFFLSGVLTFLGVHDGTTNMFSIGNSDTLQALFETELISQNKFAISFNNLLITLVTHIYIYIYMCVCVCQILKAVD